VGLLAFKGWRICGHAQAFRADVRAIEERARSGAGMTDLAALGPLKWPNQCTFLSRSAPAISAAIPA
jgi:hypothetical protein